jgi:hypothetical protein
LLVYGRAAGAYETVAVALGAPQSAQFACWRNFKSAQFKD